MWQKCGRTTQSDHSTSNNNKRVLAGQTRIANDDQQHPLSVPRFPWYY
ncbi:hypothetical protein BH09ACT11_BH09ACT11_22650 [soil metagenome]